MKKIKFLIASMIGAIALVFACVLGTKVNAAVADGTYYALASEFMPNGTYTAGTKVENLFTISGSFTDDSGNLTKDGKYDLASTATMKNPSSNYTKALKSGNNAGRTVTLDLATNQTAEITIVAFTTSSGRWANIGGEQKNISQNTTANLTGTLTSTNNTITFYCSFVEIKAVVTSSSKSLSSISISDNATVAVQNDALPTTSDMTVTAYFDDNTNSNVTSSCTISVKKGESVITDKYAEAGTYTITVSYTYGDDTKTASYDVVVSAATFYTITYYEADGTTSHEVDVKQGEDFTKTAFKGGYSFLGWSTTQGNSTADFTTTNIQATATVYPVFSSTPITLLQKDKTYTLDATKSGITSTVYQSNSSDNTYFIDNAEAGKGVKIDGSNFSLANSPSGDKNYLGIIIPAHSYAIISLDALKGNASKDAKIDFAAVLNTSAVNVSTGELTTTKTSYSVTYHNNTDDFTIIKMFRNGGTTVTVSNLVVEVKSYLNEDTTASIFAEKNTTGDTLRFIGTITGINALTDIESIELILTKDTIGTNEKIYFTKCYTSVTGSSKECKASTGTYYVIFRLTGVTGLTADFTEQIKVTFTDGSTTLSEIGSFELK